MSDDATSTSIRKELEAERATLQSQLEEFGAGQSRSDFDSNFADTSQVTAERGEAANLVQSLTEALASVDAALARLDADDYGKCEKCGNDISPARLEAQPTATRCIQCASTR